MLFALVLDCLLEVQMLGLRQSPSDDSVDALADDSPVGLGGLCVLGPHRVDLSPKVIAKMLEQRDFKIFAAWRSGMRVVPNGHLLRRQPRKISLADRFGDAQLKVFVEPVVHEVAANRVVIVAKIGSVEQADAVFGAKHPVQILQFRKALCRHLLGPVIRRGKTKRLRGEEGCKSDIAFINAKQRAVFAGATALHCGRDHDGRNGCDRARVDRPNNEGLRSAAARPSHGESFGVNVVERFEEVERANRAVGLQAHDRLQLRFSLRAKEPITFWRFQMVALLGESVGDAPGDLLTISVANHVVMKHDAAHAS